MILDTFKVYSVIRRLVKSFEDWPAYQHGIIDKDGNILRKRSTLRTTQEKDSFQLLDLLVLNIKKLLMKLPGGNSKLATYAAALWLLKEGRIDSTTGTLSEADETSLLEFLKEEAPINNAGSGNVASIGVGPSGEPGKKKKRKRRNDHDIQYHSRLSG